MARIYNKVLNHFSGLNSVALNANGDLAAVCLNDSELFVYRIIEGAQTIDPARISNPMYGSLEEGAYLEEYRFLRLSPDRNRQASFGEVHFRGTKLAFLNEETLLVAREIQRIGGTEPAPAEREHISLASIKMETGDVVAEFTDAAYGPILAAPFFIPPKYVLFTAGQTAICIVLLCPLGPLFKASRRQAFAAFPVKEPGLLVALQATVHIAPHMVRAMTLEQASQHTSDHDPHLRDGQRGCLDFFPAWSLALGTRWQLTTAFGDDAIPPTCVLGSQPAPLLPWRASVLPRCDGRP